MTHGKANMTIVLKTEAGEAYYRVVPKFPAGTAMRSFELRRINGGNACYRVWESSAGANCNCPDNQNHKGHNGQGCKHIRALRSFGMVE